MEAMRTDLQMKRERADAQMYAEYQELLKTGGSKVEIKKHLMRKYNYYTLSSVYTALKRAEKRLQMAL